MKPRPHARREQHHHADDWLMTYADMITLLLCFFAVFLTISIARKDVPKPVPALATVALPVQPKDFLEGNLPFHGLARAAAPTDDPPAPPEEPPPPRIAAPVEPDTAPVMAAAALQAVAAPHAPVETEPKGDRITILEISSAAFFGSGSATLSSAGEAILRDAAARLASDAFKGYAITVEGHTDDTPVHTAQFPSNWELSTARAASVVHFLLDQGIPARKLRAAGYADTFPKLPNRDADGNPLPENQAQNRRVVVKLEKIEPAERAPAAKLGAATPAVPPAAEY
ncbi:MAG TPA: flagellar motor protein MotB [Stellaceae bacterium]|nr:flagellar motor protein MotB [Stellaceae bacterium]